MRDRQCHAKLGGRSQQHRCGRANATADRVGSPSRRRRLAQTAGNTCHPGTRHYANHRMGYHPLRPGRARQADRRGHRLGPEPGVRWLEHWPVGLRRGVNVHRPRHRSARRSHRHGSWIAADGGRAGSAGIGAVAARLFAGMGLFGPGHAYVPLRCRLRCARAGHPVTRPARNFLPDVVRRFCLVRVLADRAPLESVLRLAADAGDIRCHQPVGLPAAQLDGPRQAREPTSGAAG
jgi:hypothetical protein